ncbi:carbohydrate-binding protein [Actinacidiphila glaucinigra]|uniref:carbohydrate-binding protein n=1 Tax=Actinacidiphila glaucinigra TaxID=235986 RepID=UPI0033B8976B
MTAGDNGAPEPGSDDPFAYLYRQDGEEPGQAATAQPGVPRTSYNQVQRVGERRPQQPQQSQQGGYGYPQQQAGYGQQPPAYGQPQPQQAQHAQATQQFPQGPGGPSGPAGPAGGGSRRASTPRPGGPNSKGLLIGAVAVVAAVAIGIGVAMAGGDDDNPEAGSTPTPTASSDGGKGDNSGEPTAPASATKTGVVDAATLVKAGGARIGSQYKGTLAAGGKYVENMNAVGASVTWKVDVPKDGSYDFWIRYGNAEKDSASATIVVNGSPQSYKPDLKNWGKEGDWNHWYRSYATLDLKQGSNTLALTCGQGDACHFNLDQLALMDKGKAPEGW